VLLFFVLGFAIAVLIGAAGGCAASLYLERFANIGRVWDAAVRIAFVAAIVLAANAISSDGPSFLSCGDGVCQSFLESSREGHSIDLPLETIRIGAVLALASALALIARRGVHLSGILFQGAVGLALFGLTGALSIGV